MKRAATILVLLLAISALAQQKPASVFPMEKSATWTYRVRVKWTRPNNTVGLKSLVWTMTVQDFTNQGRVSAALFSGNPWDFAWYEPGAEDNRGEWLLARIGDDYYLVDDNAGERFKAIRAGDLEGLEEEFAEDIWFHLPLREGDSACAPEQQESAPMYCWHVESRHGGGYQLAFRTSPDHTVVTLAPGKGITSWEYVHHGTVAEAELKLIQFRPAKAPAGVSEKPFASNKKNQ